MNNQDRRTIVQHQMSQSYMPDVDPSKIRQLSLDSTRSALKSNISSYGSLLVLEVTPVFISGMQGGSVDTT